MSPISIETLGTTIGSACATRSTVHRFPSVDGTLPAGEHIKINFYKQEAERLYRRCFGKPLAELYGVFRKAAKTTRDTVVVLNGGTFAIAHIREKTEREIFATRLEHIAWADSVSVDGRRCGCNHHSFVLPVLTWA